MIAPTATASPKIPRQTQTRKNSGESKKDRAHRFLQKQQNMYDFSSSCGISGCGSSAGSLAARLPWVDTEDVSESLTLPSIPSSSADGTSGGGLSGDSSSMVKEDMGCQWRQFYRTDLKRNLSEKYSVCKLAVTSQQNNSWKDLFFQQHVNNYLPYFWCAPTPLSRLNEFF